MVGGVLVSALKDMPNALLFEIQENLQEAAGKIVVQYKCPIESKSEANRLFMF